MHINNRAFLVELKLNLFERNKFDLNYVGILIITNISFLLLSLSKLSTVSVRVSSLSMNSS